ncbi:OPT oligopeptide transporter protein-domain-containing protein [Blyttiomyces helicus]|uniref:OPT oligopeptide transporter protein-domain-containing protein n=1 Tax=Blyttiomyces helicus TaxID=388810 RepID=A0A4P9WD11_9FUNG|nr:OPT oligopeptide transporter protein-domain-containing protein [Blyttiomyces helicus]|eukprot:RKO90222.1 OPT oligopeptide transporter protein-domain-containing protein [Blyttiomyces helicus]
MGVGEHKHGPPDTAVVKNMDAKDVLETGSMMEAASITSERYVQVFNLPLHPPSRSRPSVEFPGEQSTVAEVAATVPTSDDPTLPSLTFRFWVIGTIFTIFAAAVGQFMYFRANVIYLNSFSIILMTYPVGVFMARVLPAWRIGFHWPSDFIFTRGTFIGGSLNPGPYNIKEHALIMVAAFTKSGNAYATDILAIQRLFYGRNQNPDIPDPNGVPLVFDFPLSLHFPRTSGGALLSSSSSPPNALGTDSPVSAATGSSNLLRCGTPGTSSSSTCSTSSTRNPTRVCIIGERLRLFNKLTAWVIVYEFLPQYFATYLAHFNIVCLAFGSLKGRLGSTSDYPLENSNAPQVAFGLWPQLLGQYELQGGGFMAMTLDWQQVSSGGAFYTPFWAQLNTILPVFIGTWIVAPWMYRKNVWGANMYPLATDSNFDIYGNNYNFSKILNNETLVVEDHRYNAYSPLRLSTFWALSYGTNFAVITSLLVHVGLFHGQEILDGFRASRTEDEDVHIKIMRKYPEVPHTWYLATLVIFLGLSIFTMEYYTQYQLRWWGVLLAMVSVIIFIIPIGIIAAISNISIGTNVITEFIFGLAVPGKAIANALGLASDLKFDVYMKIPPKAVFICQLYSTFVGGVINYAVMDMIIRNVPDVWYANHQPGLTFNPDWGSVSPKIFYTASLIWGAVGPKRMFGPDSPYHPLLWFFLGGVFLPVPFYLLHRRYPNFGWDLINRPILLVSWGNGPVNGSGSSFLMILGVSWFSQYYAKRYRRNWYDKYNYTISAALDSGTIITAIIIYLPITLAKLGGGPGQNVGQYVFWALNPNSTTYADQDYCLTYSVV